MFRSGDQRFTDELTVMLDGMLSRGGAASGLWEALDYSASAAEAFCAGRQVACGRGCPHCCVLNVSVLLPEAMRIAARLAAVAEWSVLRQRLREHTSWVRWMDDEERIMRRAVCPLLDSNGSCTIHALRPLACRGVASLDRESCRRAFDPILSDTDRSVPADIRRRDAYDAAFVALANALALHGLDDRSIELGTGILAFGEMPELQDRFLARERLPRSIWE